MDAPVIFVATPAEVLVEPPVEVAPEPIEEVVSGPDPVESTVEVAPADAEDVLPFASDEEGSLADPEIAAAAPGKIHFPIG